MNEVSLFFHPNGLHIINLLTIKDTTPINRPRRSVLGSGAKMKPVSFTSGLINHTVQRSLGRPEELSTIKGQGPLHGN